MSSFLPETLHALAVLGVIWLALAVAFGLFLGYHLCRLRVLDWRLARFVSATDAAIAATRELSSDELLTRCEQLWTVPRTVDQ